MIMYDSPHNALRQREVTIAVCRFRLMVEALVGQGCAEVEYRPKTAVESAMRAECVSVAIRETT